MELLAAVFHYCSILFILCKCQTEENVIIEGVRECDGKPVLVNRKEWRARPPVRNVSMLLPVSHVIIAHTVTPQCSTMAQCKRNVQFIQDYHMDERGWFDIAYSFLIGGDGNVYVGHGWKETGAFAVNFNTNSYGIAFMGNYEEQVPSKKMLDAALQLIDCGIEKGLMTPNVEVHGHRDVACVISPGKNLYRVIRQWPHYKGGRIPGFDCSGA